MRKISAIILILLFAGVLNANAYTLLEPLPVGNLGTGGDVSFGDYVSGLIKIAIIAAALLAVVMIVIAGIMYITAGGKPGTIENAKKYIWDAIIGLIIATSFYLVLNIINPDFLDSDLGIKKIVVCGPGNCPIPKCEQFCGAETFDIVKCACPEPEIIYECVLIKTTGCTDVDINCHHSCSFYEFCCEEITP